MSRPIRIFAVTMGLVLAGATFGAIAGIVAFPLAILLTEGFLGPADIEIVGSAGSLGAIIGSVASPIAAWLLLRRVPLGRAVLWSTVGAVVGGVIGWTLGGRFDSFLNRVVPALGDAFGTAILGAIIGFLITALVLRRQASRRDAQAVHLDEPAA